MKAVLLEVSHWHFPFISKICLMEGSKLLVPRTKARKSERNILSCLGVKVIMIGRKHWGVAATILHLHLANMLKCIL